MGDYETCGRECCCGRFMRILKPVNMRMAKLQKATLDPSKISGYCGRLKCCLRFEDDTYRDLRERLPRRGARVKTADGIGTVVDVHILAQLVVILTDDGRQIAVPVEGVEVISPASYNGSRQAGDAAYGDSGRNAATSEAEAGASDEGAMAAGTQSAGPADVQGEDTPDTHRKNDEENGVDEIDADMMVSVEERHNDSESGGDRLVAEEDADRGGAEADVGSDSGTDAAGPEKKFAMRWAPVGDRGQQDGRTSSQQMPARPRRRRRRRDKYRYQSGQVSEQKPQNESTQPEQGGRNHGPEQQRGGNGA
jgi:hypothetical protein